MDECNSPGNHVEHLLSVLEGVCGSILEPEENTDENVYTLARKGDIENLKRHLDNFVDINKRDLIGGSGRSILHEATIFDQMKCVEMILVIDKDVDVNQPCFLGKDTALHFAVMNCNRDIAFILLRHGANPNQQNKYGKCPLNVCPDKDMASLLVRFGAFTSTPIAHAKFHKKDIV